MAAGLSAHHSGIARCLGNGGDGRYCISLNVAEPKNPPVARGQLRAGGSKMVRSGMAGKNQQACRRPDSPVLAPRGGPVHSHGLNLATEKPRQRCSADGASLRCPRGKVWTEVNPRSEAWFPGLTLPLRAFIRVKPSGYSVDAQLTDGDDAEAKRSARRRVTSELVASRIPSLFRVLAREPLVELLVDVVQT
jgi:hypothetical protein